MYWLCVFVCMIQEETQSNNQPIKENGIIIIILRHALVILTFTEAVQ